MNRRRKLLLFGGGVVGLLNTTAGGGADAAFSLRKLNRSATHCVRVRRSSDNAEQDISFFGGQLDTASLLAFVESGDAFVTVWYDQSGEGNNAVQTSASAQPQIVSDGEILLENSKPKLVFDGTKFMNVPKLSYTTGLLNVTSVYTAYSTGSLVAHYTVAGNNRSWLQALVTADDGTYQINVSTNGIDFISFRFDNFVLERQEVLMTQFNIESSNPDEQVKNWVNGFQLTRTTGSITPDTLFNANASIGIAARGDGGEVPIIADFQEVIIWKDTDKSSDREKIEGNINKYYELF